MELRLGKGWRDQEAPRTKRLQYDGPPQSVRESEWWDESERWEWRSCFGVNIVETGSVDERWTPWRKAAKNAREHIFEMHICMKYFYPGPFLRRELEKEVTAYGKKGQSVQVPEAVKAAYISDPSARKT